MTGQPWNVDAMHKIANLLRSWGWTVLEMDGWQDRGRPEVELHGQYIGCHHTAAAVDVDRILRDGRPDVAGPLCNFAVHLNGDLVLVAAGKANHFGVASIDSSRAWGIEATGPVPTGAKGLSAFPNYRSYLALVVAIRVIEGWGVDRIKAHKEVALPDGRKPDPAFEEGQPGDGYPSPYPEMDRFRRAASVTEVRRGAAPTPEEGPLMALSEAQQNELLTRTRHIDAMLSGNLADLLDDEAKTDAALAALKAEVIDAVRSQQSGDLVAEDVAAAVVDVIGARIARPQ